MRNIPGESGPMYLWEKVEAMPNAEAMLKQISQTVNCYLATNAMESNKSDIEKALKRAQLDAYFKDVFCFREIGFLKPTPEYFNYVLTHLKINVENVIMVGDSIESDIKGAEASA